MDMEVSLCGIIVYFVDKCIDMLFMFFGIDFCFLKFYVEWFVFFVIWEVDENVDIINVCFIKFVIKFCEVFSYE